MNNQFPPNPKYWLAGGLETRDVFHWLRVTDGPCRSTCPECGWFAETGSYIELVTLVSEHDC